MSNDSQDISALLRACADPCNSAAWQEFIARFHKLIAGVALRRCARWGASSPDVVDDRVQDTYLKLSADNARLLRDFQSQRPDGIYGYLKVITGNVVNDHFRALHSEKRGGGVTPEDITGNQCPSECEQPGSLSAIEHQVLLSEIDTFLQRCAQGESGERDRLIFRLYFGPCGLSAKEIAALPDLKLTVKGVESAILRITRLVRAEINRPARQEEKKQEEKKEDKAEAAAAAAEKGISQEKPSLKGENN